MVAKKVRAVLANGMAPVVCVGETLDEREAGETDAKVGRLIYGLAVRLEPAVGRAEDQTAAHDTFEVDAIFDQLRLRPDHALEFHFAC